MLCCHGFFKYVYFFHVNFKFVRDDFDFIRDIVEVRLDMQISSIVWESISLAKIIVMMMRYTVLLFDTLLLVVHKKGGLLYS